MKTKHNKHFLGYSAKSLLPEFNNKEFCVEKCSYLWQGFFSGGKERLSNCLKSCDEKYNSEDLNEIIYSNGVSVSTAISVTTVNPHTKFKSDIKKSVALAILVGALLVLKVRKNIKKKK